MTQFRYIVEPDKWCVLLAQKAACQMCGKTTICLDGSQFRGKGGTAICLPCVAAGKLVSLGLVGVDPDVGALRQQIEKRLTNPSPDHVEKKAEKITKGLVSTTPKVLTWQDWFWPAHCGDYCQLIRLAGQEDLNRLATDGDGWKLFSTSQYDPAAGAGLKEVWSGLKKGSIKGIADPNDNWSPMAYVFRCLLCDKLLVMWDCE